MERKITFTDVERPDNDAVAAATAEKKDKLFRQAAKLVADEKRWLRRKRLATTKLKKITAAKRRLRARKNAFEKTLKG